MFKLIIAFILGYIFGLFITCIITGGSLNEKLEEAYNNGKLDERKRILAGFEKMFVTGGAIQSTSEGGEEEEES